VVPNLRGVRTLEAFRQRHSIPEDLPPLTSDEELVAWGQQLVGKSDPRSRRREPLRATRSGVDHVAYATSVTPERKARARSADSMTLEELFDDIAARAARAHRPARLRRVS
jgi:hypothetical protein